MSERSPTGSGRCGRRDFRCPEHGGLDEEGRKRILTAHPVALGAHEIKPLAVMDIALDIPARPQHLDRYLLKTLTSQPR